jgi:Domain of unknown function (DUF4136)
MSPSSLIAVVVAASVTCAFASPASAQTKPYGVTVDVANAPALLKATTYAFTPGQPAYDKTADQVIISAIDREMNARGVKKVTSGPSDLLVTYLSVRRTDVDLKSTPSAKDGTLREYAVGTLVVSISDPADRQKKLFNGRIDKPLDLDPATIEATLNAAVAAIFEKYPRKGKTP